ncbi:MAG: hypothetical protein BEN18_05470 [Epulopiscium sp. Nuni2H_MBin001]|nr:MAG: hypothetical protein BEN18_05470 [Epulopiscium sp. Nuni2H_MBin001]
MILKSINLPQEASIDIEIYSDIVLEYPSLDKLGIDNMSLAFSLNDDSTTMVAFRDENNNYEYIHVIRAEITSADKGIDIAKALFKAISPAAGIIQLHCDGRYMLSVDLKNKGVNCTEWINSADITSNDGQFPNNLNYEKLLSENLFAFYQAIDASITRYNASLLVDDLAIDEARTAEIMQQIELCDKEIEVLKRKFKKTTQYNQQVKINVEINKLKTKKENLAMQLSDL